MTEKRCQAGQSGKTLEEIYAEHRGKVSDKWSAYLTEYDRIFQEYREKPVKLLEIGVQNGGSLEAWSRYFPNALKIVGCDIDPKCASLGYEDPRIAVVIGDVNSDDAQAAILEHAPALDIIIDDGSHRSSDVIKSFARYFPYLTNGGVYAVEDLHCSYWKEFQGGLYDPFSSVTFFKRLADTINHEHWGIGKPRVDVLKGFCSKYVFTISEEALQSVHSIEFVNSLCIIHKDIPSHNKLNARVIVGSEGKVDPETLNSLHSVPKASLDQTGNEWTMRTIPPDEELPLLMNDLAQREELIASLHQSLAEREGHIAGLHQTVTERDAQITAPYQAIAEVNAAARELASQLQAQGARTGELEATLQIRDGELASLTQTVAERDTQVADLNSHIKDLEGAVASHKAAVERQMEGATEASPGHGESPPVGQTVRTSNGKPPTTPPPGWNRQIDYSEWIARNDTLSDSDRLLIRTHIASFRSKPKFSVLMPVYNTPVEYLRQAIDSVIGQLYKSWELCVVDDASENTEIRKLLEEFSRKDARIRPDFRGANGGISACTNSALDIASGDWVVLVNHDDVISEHALYLVADAINNDPDAAIIYSDEDHIDLEGRRSNPYFKPDWDYDLFLGQNLISHLGAYRADLALRVGGFREGFDGSQDWDFALRVLEVSGNGRVHHIPFVLYHCRQTKREFIEQSADYESYQQLVGERIYPRASRSVHSIANSSVLGVIPFRADGHRDGTAYIRVLNPLRHHSLSRILTLFLDDRNSVEFLPDCDAILVQRDALESPKQANDLVKHSKKRKCRLIYEIDDGLFHLPNNHPAAGHYSPVVKEAMRTIAQQADAVIVSTLPLKERMAGFNNNVFVLPNALDEGLWQPAGVPPEGNSQSGQTRILYMGTRTHDEDLALVTDAIRRLQKKYGDRVSFTCIGGFTKAPPEGVIVENVPKWANTYPEFAKWMAQYCQYDIAVAPLADTEFNRCKSYIKYLDYGICGFAPVLSDVTPYRDVVQPGKTGLLVRNTTEDWLDALCALIEDPALRYEIGRNARVDVLEHHTLAAQAEQRQRIWTEILSNNSKAGELGLPTWRASAAGGIFSNTSLEPAREVAQRAVSEHFQRTGQAASVVLEGHLNHLRIKRALPAKRPLVSIIIPTRDRCELLRTCIDGLVNRTSYDPMEIVVVDNGSSEPDTLEFLADIRSREDVKVIQDPQPFNFSRLVNRGVATSSGEVCVLLNNDIDVINSDWLEEMVSHVLRPEVGAVGAKLYFADETLQHGGVILGLGGVAGHAHRHVPRNSSGYFNRLNLTHNLSCVTGACLAVRREVYDHIGGFDEQNLTVAFNDVDFCVRIRQAGYKVIWTPHAELYHYESLSHGSDATPEKAARFRSEVAYMRQQWGPVLDNDPFYNPQLSFNNSAPFEPSSAPRVRKPWWEFEFPSSSSIKEAVATALQAVARAKLITSVACRLTRIEEYKDQIAKYIAARDKDSSQLKDQQTIAVYTAICGGYDSIKLPERLEPRFDYFVFTDAPAPDTGVWQVRPITYFHEDKTRAARFVKTHPHMLLQGYDVAIWSDSNIMILGDIYNLVEAFVASGKAVAAIPHPMRQSIYEEEARLGSKHDDTTIMRRQVDYYRAKGFEHDDLIESNLMMFNLKDERTRPFLDLWWAEIERHSKRDQLSLNYALAQTSIEWHRITHRPNSVRNHPVFAYVSHDAGDGPAKQLIDALRVPPTDPYDGLSYATVKDQRIAPQEHRRIDIIVCVHNALEDVQRCLESIRQARSSESQDLIIIDDGSDQPAAQYLQEFAGSTPWAELHRNEHARGYVKAANKGMGLSTGELIILLNSDTIVTNGWAKKLADAVFSTPGAGIVGPMSNAASHQSIPEHLSSNGQTAINEIPPGLTAEDMNRYCEQWTAAHVLPRVPLVHGFCLGVTREVIDSIGFFDEESFPRGYGEENDYCFRAADAGFSLVVATHTYVFHAKSKSYGDTERLALAKAGSEAFARLHGRSRIQRAVKTMQENPILVRFRDRTRGLYQEKGTRGQQISLRTPRHAPALSTGQNTGVALDLTHYDFVDFGCSAGGSIAFAKDQLGGLHGLGLDIEPKKVEAARSAGFDAEVADVTKLDAENTGTVRFVIMSHFIEHLPGHDVAQVCIDSACRIAEEFVFIRQPYFDADGYLFSLGLKLYWADWYGHPYHMTSLDLHNMLSRLLSENKIRRFLIFFRTNIEDSSHPAVHPLSSPKDQQQWDLQAHGQKPEHKFTFPVFHEMCAVVLPKLDILDNRIEKLLRSCSIVFDSAAEKRFRQWTPRTGTAKSSLLAIVPLRSNGHPEGSGYIRIVRPLRHPSVSGLLRLSLAHEDSEELEQGHDTLLVQRDAVKTPEQATELVQRCEKMKIRLIYEIDDELLHLPESHAASGRFSPSVKKAVSIIARHADAVVVSTLPLKERMAGFNNNVFVLPNALDEGLWQPAGVPPEGNSQSGQTRILYMGTRTHDEDLALVTDAIRRLQKKYGDRVSFTCIGGFTKAPPEGVIVENVPKWANTYPEFAKWMAQYCQYDIAVAPLADTEFNRCKSYIKYLDYGICGFAQVLSDVTPYRDVIQSGKTGLLVRNTPDDWFNALCALIEDPALRHELGRNARQDVLAHHTLAAQAEQRQRIWSEILSLS